jgi:hypothetical protein
MASKKRNINIESANMKNKYIALGLVLILAGCSAVQKSIKYSDLDVQTKMSETVFLDPVSPDKKTVIIQVRNTSDQPALSVENEIRQAVEAKGYQVVSNPDLAHYMLQVNVLQIGRVREDEAFMSLNGGFGSTLQGAAAGAIAGGLISNDHYGYGIGGLVGAGVGTLADSMVEVMTFNMVTDIQLSEKAKGNIVTESSNAQLKQGTSGYKSSSYAEQTSWKKYQTRIISVARQANLKVEEATPALKRGLIQSLSGIL